MIELLSTIALAFVAVMCLGLIVNMIKDLFKSEGLGHINPDRKQPSVSFYGNAEERKVFLLHE